MDCNYWKLFAILLTFFYFKIQILIIPCLSVVAISTLVNSFFIKKSDDYLTDKEAFFFLLFDTCQLAILLYLTGGIYSFLITSYSPPNNIGIIFTFHFFSASSILIVIFISFFFIKIDWPGEFIVAYLHMG